MTTLYLARHGESEANVRRVFSNGRVDLPLAELGRRQAQHTAAWLLRTGRVSREYAEAAVAMTLSALAYTASAGRREMVQG